MLAIISAIIISYIIGSIPTAYIFTKIIKGIDIRKVGSGNVGATNAFRVLGRGWGITILIMDILKGLIPVIFIGSFLKERIDFIQDYNLFIIMGLCSICGHNWTIFLKFKGGKGVATTLGVLLGLALKVQGLGLVLLITIFIWFASFFLFRIISLSSVLAALAFPFLSLIMQQSLTVIIMAFILSIFIILRHKSNIKRLIRKEESSLKF